MVLLWYAEGHGVSVLRVACSSAHTDPTELSTEIVKSRNRSTRFLVEALEINTRRMIFSGCCPTKKVSIWANHGSNKFGVPNNLHLTELIAILRDPCPQRITSFSAMLNPTAFAKDQIEASMESTERNADANALINRRNESHAKARSSA